MTVTAVEMEAGAEGIHEQSAFYHLVRAVRGPSWTASRVPKRPSCGPSTPSLGVIRVSRRARQLVIALIVGVVVGAASPFIDVALSCRAPESEACVWGKAYLPLSLSISIPLIGSGVAAIAYALMAWRKRRARRNGDV